MHLQSQISDTPHTVVIYSLCHLVLHKIDNCRTFGANIIKTCWWGLTCHMSYCWILHRRHIYSCETRTTPARLFLTSESVQALTRTMYAPKLYGPRTGKQNLFSFIDVYSRNKCRNKRLIDHDTLQLTRMKGRCMYSTCHWVKSQC